MIRRMCLMALAAPMALFAQGAADSGARPLSLDEAIALAQRNSARVIQARNQVRANDASVRSAYGSFIPSLNVNYGGNRQGGETFFQGRLVPFTGNPWNFSRGLSSNLELFDGGRRMNNLRSAQANVTSAESNRRLQEFQAALEVKQQFFIVLAARESRAAAEAQLAQAEEQFKTANARVAAGVATVSDSLRSIIQVSNARLAVLQADNSLLQANNTLTRLVATPFQVTARDDESELLAAVSVDSAVVSAWVDDAPPVLQAKAALNAAVASRKAARAPYLPSLTSSFSYNGNRTDGTFDPSGTFASQYAVRLTLSYPIFNGFQREENSTRASVAEENAQAALRDAQFVAQQQYAQALGQLRLAQARMEIQQSSIAAAEEDLRVQNQRYALNSSTLLDVLTSQLTLNQARSSLIQARYDARLAKAQIEALVGRNLP